MMYRILILSVLAGPAWADCPVADDLQSGIRLLADDGAVETYRAQTADVVELTVDYDGYTDQSLLGQGVYILEVTAVEDGRPAPGTETTYDYPVSASAMPVPAEDVVWRTRVTVDGVDEEKVTATWGAVTQMSYGDCSYDVIPGKIVYTGADYRQTEGLHYLPELGFAYMASFRADGDDTAAEYNVLTITALEPGE